MSKRLLALGLTLAAASSLSGCDFASVLGTALTNASGQLGGTIYVPSTQVAIVAQGGGNLVGPSGGTITDGGAGYKLDGIANGQTGVAGATVYIRNAGPDTQVATAVTDASGAFNTTSATTGTLYHIQASFPGANNATLSVNGFAEIDPLFPCQLDVAHNMLASKLLSKGISKPDYNAFKAALAAMENDIATNGNLPSPTDQASAAAAFDTYAASAGPLVAAMANTP